MASVEGIVCHMSTSQTKTTNRAQAAIWELFHGVQKSLEAFENRPAAHLVPQNDDGHTAREEHGQHSLDM